jgi:hypothetical protein
MLASKKKLLFVTYGGGHVNMVISVINLLKKTHPNWQCQVLGLTSAGKQLAINNIDYLGFSDFAHLFPSSAVEFGEQLCQKLPAGPVAKDESIAYLGLSFYDLILKHGPDKAKKIYATKGRQAFNQTDVMETIIKQLNPDVVIATNSPRAERAAIDVASKLNIPSICMVDMLAKQEVAWIKHNNYASKVCVLNEYVKDLFISEGRAPEHIVVTGNPAFDAINDKAVQLAADKFRVQQQLQSSHVILWASQPEPQQHPFTDQVSQYPDLPRQIESCLYGLANKHPEWQFIFRYHPSEPFKYQAMKQLDNLIFSQADHDINILVNASDLLITTTSTVGLQGVYAAKPLISITTSVFNDDMPYAEMGMATGINDLQQLEATISTQLAEYKRNCHESETGDASSKVCSVIEGLIEC